MKYYVFNFLICSNIRITPPRCTIKLHFCSLCYMSRRLTSLNVWFVFFKYLSKIVSNSLIFSLSFIKNEIRCSYSYNFSTITSKTMNIMSEIRKGGKGF